jgi:cytoskeletal protein RodZ
VRGFLRSYAHHLGLDGQLFVDEYNSRHFDPRDDDVFPRRRPTARERRNRKRESHIILIAIVAIVALAVLVIAAASYPGNAGKDPTRLPAATSAPVQTGVGNSALTVTTIAAATTTTQETSGKVTVVAERPCYVTVYEGEGTKGRVLFSDTLDPDTKLADVTLPRVEGGYTFELGNAGGVSFVVGDRHLFSPDNMNVFWLDPDTEQIKPIK